MSRPPIVTVRELEGLRVQLFISWPDRQHEDQEIELDAPNVIHLQAALGNWLWTWAQRAMLRSPP